MPETSAKIRLTDDEFFQKAADEREFRNALILDKERAIAGLELTGLTQSKLHSTIGLVDQLVRSIARTWFKDEKLKQHVNDRSTLRVLFFTPEKSAKMFELSPSGTQELMAGAEMANTVAQATFEGAKGN